ncbi:MAG: hypothetical protein QOE35_1796 [Actinomycetota bacterium]
MEGSGAIGQARLAVIDLLTGDPPIANGDRSVGATLNGEIYNFQSLRAELAAGGHDLKTQGDTEVLVHLAEDLEPVEMARRLDGMFAFAVLDGRRDRLVLGRDPVGKKPLYYFYDGRVFVFGSEIKAVIGHPQVPRRLNERALPAYLTFGYVPTPETFYDGVRSVPPGHVLWIERGAAPVIEPFWEPQVPGMGDTTRLDLSLDAAAAGIRERLARAVEKRLVADVPLGAFLSGGIDSSTVVALMAQMMDEPVRTFTIGFDQPGADERDYARLVAKRYKTDHTEFVVQPHGTGELIEQLVWHYDQPFGDSSALPTFILSELTRAEVTVALCGDGGDELFAGYKRFVTGQRRSLAARTPRPLRQATRRALAAMPTGRTRAAAGRLANVELSGTEAQLSWVARIPGPWRDRLLPDADRWAIDDYERLWAESDGGSYLDRMLLLNLQTYLLDDLLPKIDRMSMAHALELRSPFLDRELVEFALRLPDRTRVSGATTKRALRAAMAADLPAEIMSRGKRGFQLPLNDWFRNELADYARSMLCDPRARVRQVLAPEALDDLVAGHLGGGSYGRPLWTLITLEVFLRTQDL